MGCQQKRQAILFFLVAVILLCTSCQTKLEKNAFTPEHDDYSYNCRIDVTSPTDCPLSMGQDQRAVWINPSNDDYYYVCFDPASDPFEAYSWRIPPKGGKRKTGKIQADVKPPYTVEYWTSKSPCGEKSKTNPKIIIGD
jgi:hypothetical protein